uniref:Uncharacterized protein n=1 Tax=Tanacetum cinerariifolium TaxID=118510 RepID=A0A6L2P3T8_TANCI|nr:hypothetical protein [Tanacetum cinerariifolium]
MTSFDYHLNPLYPIKECSSCEALYTTDCCYSNGSLMDKIRCALLQKKFKEYLFTYCIEDEIFQDFQDTSEPSNDNTNVVNALQGPFVVKQDPGENYTQMYINTSSWDRPTICYSDDDDKDCTIAITPILSTEELDNSLSMGDKHLDTILATGSDEFIKSSVENLVLIPSESKGIPDNMCDMPFHDNYPPLDVSKYQFEDFSNSNDDSTSIDDDSFSIDDIEYVEASPPNSELVSLAMMEIVIPKVGGIDDDILLTIKDDIVREKLLNINLLIANIEALKDNPTLFFDFMTKSSSTSLNFLLEETNTFNNSLLESETFCFDLEGISSGIPLLVLIFLFQIMKLSMTIMLKRLVNEPNSGDFTMDVVEDIFPTREPRVHVHNVLPTHPTLQLNLDFILSSESLFAYVVWIFLPFLSYLVAP